ncbi:uncharacterized protein LOC111265808 isoform X2 [Varroa jacobsoni]|uniref:BZIP domain-containing protein n=1 Tax=Varroa destructor TaxID=109461 RepID=A0A7M7K6D3_VARDE|nr:uncharacterized protein LOC111250318 isoform X2 [Varroa destructor]XP_022698487.1 uncharacterized protein LOC111265808 isoform X2 [Varroa jacobsoni]
MDLSVEFRPALGVKRESSVSPPGWDHSSEGDRPLDFSRQSPSATNEKVANDADSSPAKKCAVSEPEQDSPRTMPDQRKLLLTNPQQLRFHDMHCPTSPPQSLSPNFQAIMGLAPNVLQSNEDHLNLYESLVLKSLQSGSSPQHIFDPGYLHFRNQFLLQKKMQNTQRRKTVSMSTPTTTSLTPIPKSSDSTEPSSELSDQSNDSSHVHHNQADSTNRTAVLPTVTSPPSSALPTSSSNSNGTSRRRGNPFPEELKDTAYWERRRKNNEAAKRSRDARRAKEDEIAIRAAYLEQENIKLKVELSTLNQQLAHLRAFVEARQI